MARERATARARGSRAHPQMHKAHDIVCDAQGEIESLHSEMEEWQQSLEGAGMDHLPKYDEVAECVDTLDTARDCIEEAARAFGEMPEALRAKLITYTIDTRRKARSRNAQRSNICNGLWAVKDWLDGFGDFEEATGEEGTDDQIDEFETLRDQLGDGLDSLENAEFPSMF